MKKLLFLCLSWLLFQTSGQAQDEMSFTWDLTTNSWASQSPDLVVWESSFATMESIGGNGIVVNEILGGGGNENTKFPMFATIRFTPKQGVNLRSIDIYTTASSSAKQLQTYITTALQNDESDKYDVSIVEGTVFVRSQDDYPLPGFEFMLDYSIRLTAVKIYYLAEPFTPTMTHVNDLYWSTMYLDYPVDIPSGVNAYYVTVEDNVARLNAIDGVIPANTGVILRSETAGPFQFNQTTNSVTTDVSGNRLVGWISDRSISGQDNTYYVLSTKNGQIGFYIPKGTENDTYPIVANKAYLKLNKAVSVKELQFVIDDTPTAVETVREQTDSSHETYNLQGMRVSDDYRGIIIKDGRKVYRK